MTTPRPTPAEEAEFEDRLVDQLLRETVGREAVPDVLPRVLARDRARKSQWRLRVMAGASIAATVFLLAGAWVVWPARYPGPTAVGPVATSDGGPVRRGATVDAKGEPALLKLGGYVELSLDPGGSLKVEGTPEQERIALQSGTVHCKVQKGHGGFEVATPSGLVKVTGTQFTVEASTTIDSHGFKTDAIGVKVTEGSVRVIGGWGERDVIAGQDCHFTTRDMIPVAKQGRVAITGLLTTHADGLYVVDKEGKETLVMALKDIPANYHPLAGRPYVVVWEDGHVVTITSVDGEK